MAHRKPLLDLLHSYGQLFPDEQGQTEKFINFVINNEDCFLRSNLSGHVTGSCFLVSIATNEVLLTHHKKIGEWLQLGGHADGDTDILRVALKEAQEESGIDGIVPLATAIFDLDVHEIDKHKDVGAHFHYDARFLLAAPHRDFIVSDESDNLAWRPIASLIHDTNISTSIKRMAEKWQRMRF